MFAEYDENEIGALDCEEIEGEINPLDDMVLRLANEEFDKRCKVAMCAAHSPLCIKKYTINLLYFGSMEFQLTVLKTVHYSNLLPYCCLNAYSSHFFCRGIFLCVVN